MLTFVIFLGIKKLKELIVKLPTYEE